MKTKLIFAASLLACLGTSAQAAGEEFATGNMAEAVKAMDANSDGMISKSEFMAYRSAEYDRNAAQFATGNMTDAVKARESSKKQAYLKSEEAHFDQLQKNADGLVPAKDVFGYLKGAGNK